MGPFGKFQLSVSQPAASVYFAVSNIYCMPPWNVDDHATACLGFGFCLLAK